MAYKEDLKAVGISAVASGLSIVAGDLVNQYVKNKPVAYALVGALETAGAMFSKQEMVKGGLVVGSGVLFALAVIDYLKSKNMYPLQAMQGNVPVVYVNPEQSKKKGIEVFGPKVSGVATY